jgi:hypothetical protein
MSPVIRPDPGPISGKRREGLAEPDQPDQPARRKPQEDAWRLTPLGRVLVIQMGEGEAAGSRGQT